MFRLIAIDFSQKSPFFSLLPPTSPCELSEREFEVTSSSNLKVVRALDNNSLVIVIFINFFGQLKDWVGQVLSLVSCPKGQVEKYVNVEAWYLLLVQPVRLWRPHLLLDQPVRFTHATIANSTSAFSQHLCISPVRFTHTTIANSTCAFLQHLTIVNLTCA
jgi:hypothetical protein